MRTRTTGTWSNWRTTTKETTVFKGLLFLVAVHALMNEVLVIHRLIDVLKGR